MRADDECAVGSIADTLDIAALTAEARCGDEQAAAALIAHFFPYWLRAAHGIVRAGADGSSVSVAGPPPNTGEAAELVQNAVLKLLELWRRGEGPDSNLRSYATSMMRNAYSNQRRSPGYGAQSLHGIEAVQLENESLREVEVANDLAVVRQAFDELNEDQRALLHEIVVLGRKPGDVAQHAGVPAAVISNRLSRAKHAMRRGLLLGQLGRGDGECAENAAQLPPRVRDDFAQHAEGERGLAHVLGCELCRANWRRFGLLTSALGLLPLVAVTQLPRGTAAANAASGHSREGAAGEGPAVEGPAVDGTGGGRGIATAASGGRGRIAAALTSKAALVSGVSLVAVSLAAFGLHAVHGPREATRGVENGAAQDGTAPGAPEPRPDSATMETAVAPVAAGQEHGVEFDARLNLDENGTLHALEADLAIDGGPDARVREARLSLPSGVVLVAASNGMTCEGRSGAVMCAPGPSTDASRAFVFTVVDELGEGELALDLVVETDEQAYRGRAVGSW